MKKILRVLKLGVASFFIVSMLGGCAVANLIANIKPDSSVLVFTSEINNTHNVNAEGKVFYKNVDTDKEGSFLLHPGQVSYLTKKLEPGNYVITKWVYNACRFSDKNGLCKSKHDFVGTSTSLGANSFSILKGETVYLGRFIVNAKSRSLSLIDNSLSDINKLKNHYSALQTRKIKNISEDLKINNWKFVIKRRKIFGL